MITRDTEYIGLADADSTIPNLALMRLSAYFKQKGKLVKLIRPGDQMIVWEGFPKEIFGSSIFKYADKARKTIEKHWGHVQWGGTGVNLASSLDEIDNSVEWDRVAPDYSLYPEFTASLGFTQRGCRQSCEFCVVPRKEGKPRHVAMPSQIWRGPGHPKHIVLLDNDFFGQPSAIWREIIREIREGAFKVAFIQGINTRLVRTDEAAEALASIEYRDAEFRSRRLYTAWDDLDDEMQFKAGVARLHRAGIPPKHLMVYMLVGYRAGETWDEVWHRFYELVNLGCLPYPMVYDRSARPDLCAFQRWVLRGLYRAVPWPEYARDGREDKRIHGAARVESDEAWHRTINRSLVISHVR